jgi:hypothetical protein
VYIEQSGKFISDIEHSQDLRQLWDAYRNKYPYAAKITFSEIITRLKGVFQTIED